MYASAIAERGDYVKAIMSGYPQWRLQDSQSRGPVGPLLQQGVVLPANKCARRFMGPPLGAAGGQSLNRVRLPLAPI